VRGDDDDGKTMGKLWKDDDDGGGAGDDDDDVEYFYSDPSSPWNSAAMRKKKQHSEVRFQLEKRTMKQTSTSRGRQL
jgi:hypothetical protein